MYILEIESTNTGFMFYGNFDRFAFKIKIVTFKKINFLGFCVVDVSKIKLYETYHNKQKQILCHGL